jgi:murein L,D-transpeptidase YcbB/YkuD
LPLNYKPWGCGAGSKGSLNNTHLQFEICRDNMASKDYFNKVYNEACELTAYYCKLYNLDPLGTFVYNGVTVPVITSHAESYKLKLGSNHGDPLKWLKKFGKTMDDVRKDVAALMGIVAPNKPSNNPSTDNDNSTVKVPQQESNEYTLKQFIRDVQSATGAKVDGIAGNETISKTVTLSANKNSRHAAVKAVQKRLYALGYTQVGAADGIAGAKFTAAVKAYQKANGCAADGEITAKNKTWKKLLGMA